MCMDYNFVTYIFLAGGCPSLSSKPPAAVDVKSNSCDPNPSITLSWTPASITATAEATAELLSPAAPSMGMREPRPLPPPTPPPPEEEEEVEEEEGLVAEEVAVLPLEVPIRPPPLP